MKKVILSALVAGLFIGTSCSKDDDDNNNNGTSSHPFEGQWKYEEYEMEGSADQTQGGFTYSMVTTNSLVGGNGILEFKTNPNVYSAIGDLEVLANTYVIMDGDTISSSSSIETVSALGDEGQWEDLGSGKVKLTADDGSFTFDYSISGNMLTISGPISVSEGGVTFNADVYLLFSKQ